VEPVPSLDYPVMVDCPRPIVVGRLVVPIEADPDNPTAIVAGRPQTTFTHRRHDGCVASTSLEAYVEGPEGRLTVGVLTGCGRCLPPKAAR
jgi:hypothetical protein